MVNDGSRGHIGVVGAVLIFVVIIGLLFVHEAVMRALVRYGLRDGQVRVSVANVPLCRIPLSSITEIRKVFWADFTLPAFARRLASRPWASTGVMITRKIGLFRHVIITPEFPDVFIDQVLAEMHARGIDTSRVTVG